MTIRQATYFILMATILGVVVNLVSPNSIAYIGKYRIISDGSRPIIPPTAEEGDPPFIDINQAQLEFTTRTALFVDAREPDEFECATIPGSFNIPFEQLPDDNLAGYIDSCLDGSGTDWLLIVFCSGEECEVSLHLARNLIDLGYRKVAIFFGGSREWERFGFGMQRGAGCED